MSAPPDNNDDDDDDKNDTTTRPQHPRSQDMTSHEASTDTTATATRPDQPLHDPLPYGAGFTDPHEFGYGVSPDDHRFLEPEPTPGNSTAVARRERSGSPVLAVAGLLSLGVAVWAILGAPVLTSTVVITAVLVLLILVGLAMVVRR